MTKRNAIAIALIASLPTAAFADWAGYYAGGALGTISDPTFSYETDVFGDDLSGTRDVSSSSSLSGFGGILMQTGQFVYGAEIEIASAPDIALDTFLLNGPFGFVQFDVDHGGVILDLKGRAGMSFGQFLPYGVIGLTSYKFVDTQPSGTETDLDQTGFSIGAGVDMQVTSNLFVGVEYLARSASGSNEFPAYNAPFEHSSHIDTLSVRAGFRF